MDLQKLLNNYGITCDVRIILDKWSEPHRRYHGMDHLTDLISQINEDFGNGEISANERDKLVITSLFHDIVYEVRSNLNEEKSADFFYRLCSEKHDIDVVEIKQMILDTKNHVASTPLSSKFIKYDLSVCEKKVEDLLEWERSIREEYISVNESIYKQERLKFLESMVDRFPNNMDNLLDLINWVKTNYN